VIRDTARQLAFRQILEREAGPAADSLAMAAAARRLCDRFADQLRPLIGDAGVNTLWARGVFLLERRFPGLTEGIADGIDPCERAGLSFARQPLPLATDSAVALFTIVTDLLASFIGEGLLGRLLGETWPSDFSGDSAEETTT
jgi:hypothetical protein